LQPDARYLRSNPDKAYLVGSCDNLGSRSILKKIVVRSFYLKLTSNKSWRHLFAVAFLLVLLAEWGSHSVIPASAASSAPDEQSISADEGGHEDPCQTLVICNEGPRKDRQAKLSHDSSPHNGLFGMLADSNLNFDVPDDPRMSFPTANRLYRPPNPPFHPPKNS
jgi:hypothetical protein